MASVLLPFITDYVFCIILIIRNIKKYISEKDTIRMHNNATCKDNTFLATCITEDMEMFWPSLKGRTSSKKKRRIHDAPLL